MIDESAVEDIIRVGVTSSIKIYDDHIAHTARVYFKDKDMTSGSLTIAKALRSTLTVGAYVVCLFPPNGEGDGIIIAEV